MQEKRPDVLVRCSYFVLLRKAVFSVNNCAKANKEKMKFVDTRSQCYRRRKGQVPGP